MQEIPILDIGAGETSDRGRKAAVAGLIDSTFTEIGFLVITGHGVPASIIREAEDAAAAFFALPLEEKLQARGGDPLQVRGYVPQGGGAAGQSRGKATPPDIKENFSMGPPAASRSGLTEEQAKIQFASNIWPDRPTGLRSAFEVYYRELEKLAFRLMPLFAAALRMEEDFFQPYFSAHNCVLRAQHYPALREPPLPGQLRIGAHTDFGAFTILHIRKGEGSRGLQVRNRQGDWIDIAAADNSFVVNLGDLMMTWTNDRWQSNMHRVVNPEEGGGANVDRLSIPFFANPNYDALIECIPSCAEAGSPARHPPILAGEHRLNQFKKTALYTG